MKIVIYHDFVHHSGPLYKALAARYGAAHVQYVNADDVIGGALETQPDMFVMPGGASRYVAAKLDGDGNTAIKKYVQHGGFYMGICAGGYYACANTIWAADTPHEMRIVNELAFFAADAVGPIPAFGPATSRSDGGLCLTHLDSDGRKIPALYMGGAQFVPHKGAVYTTHATFKALDENNAAVVSGTFGNGKWLLMSPHLEMDHASIELMRFNVAENRYAGIAGLPDTSALKLEYLYELLDGFLGD